MKPATESRESIAVTVLGTTLQGTCHWPGESSANVPVFGGDGRLGLLLMNSGFLPRAGIGDSSVYWADSLARLGYPVFRLDLPALGDSGGDIPVDLLDFINTAGYATVLSEAVTSIVERHNLAGMAILGHCAGAVSALFAAATCRYCRGLILLDPYFHLPQKRAKIRDDLSRWASANRVGGRMSDIYDLLKRARLLFRGNKLPANTNWALLRCWGRLASQRMPILILKAPPVKSGGTSPRVGTFDYVQHFQSRASQNDRMVVKFIAGTNHTFADRVGRGAVRQQTEQWLRETFPCSEVSSISAAGVSKS